MSWNAGAPSNPTPWCSSDWRARRAAWTAPSSAPSMPFARNFCAAARWRRASIRSSRNLRSPMPCAFSPASSAAGSRRNCPRPPLPCRVRWRASPGGRNAIAASRSTNCEKLRGIWRSGAISTIPGKSGPSRATRTSTHWSRLRKPRCAFARAPVNFRRISAPCASSCSACSVRGRPGWWTPIGSRARCCGFPARCAGSRAGMRWLPPGKS